ncbi:MAG: HAD-IA family hydrolase [Firmicutes bacterium]|nr:HAD-IA family hydrolase [Bacillota bacterium]
MNGYQEEQGLLVRTGADSLLPHIRLIIFDIDGVLVDAREAYAQAILTATRYHVSMLQRNHGLAINDERIRDLLTPAIIASFKAVGGFNDEWDIAYVLSLWCTWLTLTSEHPLTPQEGLTQIHGLGGGVEPAERLFQSRNPELWPQLTKLTSRPVITRLTQEIYAGDEATPALFGGPPRYVHGRGTHWQERNLLSPSELDGYHGFLGIYTGRNRAEAALALNRTGLARYFPDRMQVTASDGVLKPDPQGLQRLCADVPSQPALFIGDTIDDLEAVRRFRERHQEPPLLFAAVTRSSAMEPYSRAIFQHVFRT